MGTEAKPLNVTYTAPVIMLWSMRRCARYEVVGIIEHEERGMEGERVAWSR